MFRASTSRSTPADVHVECTVRRMRPTRAMMARKLGRFFGAASQHSCISAAKPSGGFAVVGGGVGRSPATTRSRSSVTNLIPDDWMSPHGEARVHTSHNTMANAYTSSAGASSARIRSAPSASGAIHSSEPTPRESERPRSRAGSAPSKLVSSVELAAAKPSSFILERIRPVPKSATFTRMSLSTKQFSALRSRWIEPQLWRYCMPDATSNTN
mmetsp:Transcript_26538/g.69822  ORF Transcript_26538/g.69822 Transcript_26538/m.69822 type:complete len:213 (-) Transcript_26538:803-1441(-)